jgi:hypothetical protein
MCLSDLPDILDILVDTVGLSLSLASPSGNMSQKGSFFIQSVYQIGVFFLHGPPGAKTHVANANAPASHRMMK